VLLRQLIEGTEIGATAAANYGAAIVGSLRGYLADGVTAIGVTGEGVEPLG